MEANKLVAMKGFLRVERLGITRTVSLDIDFKRSSSRSLQLVGCRAMVIGEDTFPIERLRLGPATKAVLVLSGINTLSKIPRNIDELRALPLNDEQIRELLDELRAFGYILHGGRTLLWQKPRQGERGTGWIIQSFLTKPVKELNLNAKIWMKLSSRGIQTIEQLCDCDEGVLKYVHKAGKDIEKNLRLKQDELEEIKTQLEYYGLSLKDKSQEKTERWSELWEEEMKLLKVRSSNKVTLEQAKKILKNQYELFLGFREAKTATDRIAWRNAIVVRNLGWVAQAVRYVVPEMIRQEDPCMDFDDLFQEGAIGCMRGVSLYDMTSGYVHTTYLTSWIRAMAQRFILETAGIPVHKSESLAKLRKAYKTLGFQGNHHPDAQALAEVMGVSPEEVEKLLILVQIGFDKHCSTLDFVAYTGDGKDVTAGDDIASDFPEWPDLMEESDRNLDLKKAVLHILDTAPLMPIEREVLELHFGLKDGYEYTMEAIGDKYGVTRARIDQHLANALEQLRTVEAYHRVKELVPRLLSPSVVISNALWLDAIDCWKYLLETRQGAWTANNVLDVIAGFFELGSKKILTLASQGRPAVAQYVFVSFCILELEVSRVQLVDIIGYRLRRFESMRRELCLKFEEMGYAIEKGSITSLASRAVTKESLILGSLQNISFNSIEETLNTIAHKYGVSLDDLQSKGGRFQENVEARFEAIYQLRTKLKLSFSRIAEVLGYESYTSVIHGYQKAKEKRQEK